MRTERQLAHAVCGRVQLRQEQEKRELETQLALERRIALEKQLHEERENRLAEEIGRIRAELLETQRKVQSPAGMHLPLSPSVAGIYMHTYMHK